MARMPFLSRLAIVTMLVTTCFESGVFDTARQPPAPATHALTFGVMGDLPYTFWQRAMFGRFIEALSTDAALQFAIHLGDIKRGGTPCSDAYYHSIRTAFNRYEGALMYTPGDNEWTDCHEGAQPMHPVDRLGALRRIFFHPPGQSLGRQPRQVQTQGQESHGLRTALVENQAWTEAGIVFGLLHVPGSNNGLAPWTPGVGNVSEQMHEFEMRLAADLAWLQTLFSLAEEREAAALVLGMQADMWDGSEPPERLEGYTVIVQTLAWLTLAYARPVLVLQGDSHDFLIDHPLRNGDPLHGVYTPVPALTRVVVQGGGHHLLLEYLRVTIHSDHNPPFQFERVVPSVFTYMYQFALR
jgi:hypothetical protein